MSVGVVLVTGLPGKTKRPKGDEIGKKIGFLEGQFRSQYRMIKVSEESSFSDGVFGTDGVGPGDCG